MEAFTVRRSMRAVPQDDQVIHLEGVAPNVWQSVTCERVGKLSSGGSDLA